MTRVVQYRENGDIDRLEVGEITEPHAAAGEVRVAVRYAGLNPVDWKILSGAFGPLAGTAINGTDFSGVIDEVGEGVEGFAAGDLVYGGHQGGAQAEHLVVSSPGRTLHRVPRGLGIETAGGLGIAARTAIAGIRVIAPRPGETVYVSGASGGVGIVAAQLAVNLGAHVIGGASEANHELLRRLGVEPVLYGDGLAERLRALAPHGIDAAFSAQDASELDLLIGLGVPATRINAIGAAPADAESRGVHRNGTGDARPGDLDWAAQAIAYGHLRLPIAKVFPLADIVAAYDHLQHGHPAGKVLLRFDATPLTDEERASLLGE